jgi:hypothetical protein
MITTARESSAPACRISSSRASCWAGEQTLLVNCTLLPVYAFGIQAILIIVEYHD